MEKALLAVVAAWAVTICFAPPAAEKERLDTELRRIKSLLRSALDSLAEADTDERPPVGEQTGEIRRLIG